MNWIVILLVSAYKRAQGTKAFRSRLILGLSPVDNWIRAGRLPNFVFFSRFFPLSFPSSFFRFFVIIDIIEMEYLLLLCIWFFRNVLAGVWARTLLSRFRGFQFLFLWFPYHKNPIIVCLKIKFIKSPTQHSKQQQTQTHRSKTKRNRNKKIYKLINLKRGISKSNKLV